MTKKNDRPHDTIEQSQEDRIQRCAELGQIVPINKARSLRHYQGLNDEAMRDPDLAFAAEACA